MDRPALLYSKRFAFLTVKDMPRYIKNVAKRNIAYRYFDRPAGIGHYSAAHQAIRGLQRYSAYNGVPEMLFNFQRDSRTVLALNCPYCRDLNSKRIVYIRHMPDGELNIDH